MIFKNKVKSVCLMTGSEFKIHLAVFGCFLYSLTAYASSVSPYLSPELKINMVEEHGFQRVTLTKASRKIMKDNDFNGIMIEYTTSLDNTCSGSPPYRNKQAPLISIGPKTKSFLPSSDLKILEQDNLRRTNFNLEYNYGIAGDSFANRDDSADPGAFVIVRKNKPKIRGKEVTVNYAEPLGFLGYLSGFNNGGHGGFCNHTYSTKVKIRFYVHSENSWLEVERLGGSWPYHAPIYSGIGQSLMHYLKTTETGAEIRVYSGPQSSTDTVKPKIYGFWFLRPDEKPSNYVRSGNANNLVDNIIINVNKPLQMELGVVSSWGDGFSDTNWISQNITPRMLADVNKDGLDDLIGFKSDGVYVGISTGKKFQPATKWASDYGQGNGWSSNDLRPRIMGDINGDKMADIVGFGSSGVVVSLSNGNGFDKAISCISESYSPATGWDSDNLYPRIVADVNGDGRDDIIGFSSGGVGVSLAKKLSVPPTAGNCFEDGTEWSTNFHPTDNGKKGWTSNDQYPRYVADVNGDGNADIVGFASDGVIVALSNGKDGFTFDSTPWIVNFNATSASSGWYSNNIYPRRLADVNGDGRADIIGFSHRGVAVALSTGRSFEVSDSFSTKYLGETFSVNGGWGNDDSMPRLVGNVTGTDLSAIVGIDRVSRVLSVSEPILGNGLVKK